MSVKYIKRIVNLDGNPPTDILPGAMFTGESRAHVFMIYCRQGMAPLPLTGGTVSGDFLNANNQSVACTGSIVNGVAVLQLPPACYAVRGRFTLTIYHTEDGATGAIYRAEGKVLVSGSDTTIDPGTVIASVAALIANIAAAVETIPPEYTSLMEAVAPLYPNLAFPVSAGELCWYAGALYRAKQAIPSAENWTASHWETAVIGNDLAALKEDVLDLARKSDVLDALDGKIQYHAPVNWLDTSAVTTGYYVAADGTVTESASQCYSDYIPVAAGDKVKVFRGDTRVAIYRTHICLYNAGKEAISGGNDNAATSAFTIPAGAAFVRVSFAGNTPNPMVVRDGQTPSAYSAYFAPYFSLTEDFLTDETAARIAALEADVGGMAAADDGDVGKMLTVAGVENGKVTQWALQTPASGGGGGDPAMTEFIEGRTVSVEPVNWLDTSAITTGSYVKSDGTVTEAGSQIYTDYVPVAEGDKIKLLDGRSGHFGDALYRTHICLYNAGKEAISGGNDTAATSAFTVPAGAAYIRLSCASSNLNCQPMLVRNDQTPSAYSAYFAPYWDIASDFLTPETAEKLDSLPDGIAPGAVKGSNLIPLAETGTGAYYASGSKIIFSATGSYANYRYAVIPVRPNTLYSFNFVPHWFILATDEGVIVQSGTDKPGYFVETGNATKFYCTFSSSVWINGGVIVAEGISGRMSGMIKPQFLSGLNQLVHDSWYAMALPPKAVRFTKDLQEKFYYDNILALDANFVTASFGGYSGTEDDGVLITPDSVNSGGNGYRYTVYDENLSVVQSSVNYTGTLYVYADNVQDCSALLIGDSTVAQNTMGQKLIDAFQARGKTITLLGTNGSGSNRHEGRSGWSTVDYMGGSARGADPAQNAFYNPSAETFDFSYYMQEQNYSAVDFVVIQLGINDLYSATLGEAREKISATAANVLAMIDSILAFNASQKTLLNLPTPCNGNSSSVSRHSRRAIRAKFANYNALMQLLVTKYGSKVRCSHAHLVLNPMTDINDNIHPNAAGYNKMALAILSQINAWQNA